jgi:hypothetical protein
MSSKDRHISLSFRPNVELDADQLSEDYDEDPYFQDFEDKFRQLVINEEIPQEEEEKKEVTED